MSEILKGIHERMKKGKKSSTVTGLLQKILVYEHGKPMGEAALLGSGWTEVYNNGVMSAPDLYDFQGVRLPPGWYQLVPTEEFKHVILPTMKHRKVKH